MRLSGKVLLIIGGCISFILSILEIIIIFIGSSAYRFIGAGDKMILLSETGSVYPGILTFSIAVTLFIFGIFAFSGAGLIRRVAHTHIALPIIGSIFILRGLGLIVQIVEMFAAPGSVMTKDINISMVALLTGFIYLTGTKKNWDYINTPES